MDSENHSVVIRSVGSHSVKIYSNKTENVDGFIIKEYIVRFAFFKTAEYNRLKSRKIILFTLFVQIQAQTGNGQTKTVDLEI